MQVSDIKKSLHQRIDAEQDGLLLQSLLDALELSKGDVFQIPINWLTEIEQGRKDIELHNSASEAEFDEKFKKWL